MGKLLEKHTDTRSVPTSLIYEQIDGKAVYYQGYQAVLANQKKLEEIMGTSVLQGLIISCLVEYLFNHLPSDKYKVLFNELGLHLEKGNNLSADIAIYERAQLKGLDKKKLTFYAEIPPKVIIEVDTKADLDPIGEDAALLASNYYSLKTQKLLEFGVEKVIWIYSQAKLITVATPSYPWLTSPWNDEIEIFPGSRFSLEELLKQDGII